MSHAPRSLSELELAWLKLFTKLRCAEAEAGTHPSSLAAPFLSTALLGYEPGGPGTVMLVGKATAGKNTLGNADVTDVYDAATVKRRTPAVVEEVISGEYGSGFWRFARKLSDAGAEQARSHAAPFANLIWTNIAKIGVAEGNPSASLFRNQDTLAVETILAEALFYKPHLVVFATSWYRYGCVNRILQQLTGAKEGEGLSQDRDWSSPRRADAPAVLWTGHPERKPRAWIESKIARAKELMAG